MNILEALDAIRNGDSAELAGRLAPDEGVVADDARSIIGEYPTLVDFAGTPTINVFRAGSETLYFGYAVVHWRDAGIVSEHTIAIPVRYVNGQWFVSTMGLDTPGIEFVQSVQVR